MGLRYAVTPLFRKGCLQALPRRRPLPNHPCRKFIPMKKTHTTQKTRSASSRPRWDVPMLSHWTMGEKAAQNRLKVQTTRTVCFKRMRSKRFIRERCKCIRSPHLHFGEISPNQVWYAFAQAGIISNAPNDLDCFHSELAWREFSHSLLYFNPALPEKPLNKKFKSYEWNNPDPSMLEKWKKKNQLPDCGCGNARALANRIYA